MSNALKRKGKPKPSFAPLNITNYQTEKIAALVGVKTNALMAWQEAREKEITDATVDEFNEKLCRAEDYLAFANVLISMYAIKMTWGVYPVAGAVSAESERRSSVHKAD